MKLRAGIKVLLISLFLSASSCFSQKRTYAVENYSMQLVEKAESGDAKAQFDLGFNYYKRQDLNKAFEYFKKSADQKFPEALIYLKKCFLEGAGTQKDELKANEISQKIQTLGINEEVVFIVILDREINYQMEENVNKLKSELINNKSYWITPDEKVSELQKELPWIYTTNGIIMLYAGSENEVSIPNEIQNTKIIEIGTQINTRGWGLGQAFTGNKTVTKVQLHEGIISIGPNAFAHCTNLSSINFPSALQNIGCFAFRNCENLQSVELKNPLVKIGWAAFEGCKNLTNAVLPDGKTQVLKATNMSEEKWNSCQISSAIPGAMFRGCSSLKEINIPASVRTVSFEAFSGCSGLKSVSLPEGLQSIEMDAFAGAALLEINIPNSVTQIGERAFAGNKNLRRVTLPNGIEKIESSVFSECSSLEEITIPESVKTIGNSAFYGCSNLKKINISPNLKDIGVGAFFGTGLPEAVLKSLPEAATKNPMRRMGGSRPIVPQVIRGRQVYLPTGSNNTPQGP